MKANHISNIIKNILYSRIKVQHLWQFKNLWHKDLKSKPIYIIIICDLSNKYFNIFPEEKRKMNYFFSDQIFAIMILQYSHFLFFHKVKGHLIDMESLIALILSWRKEMFFLESDQNGVSPHLGYLGAYNVSFISVI